MSLTLFLVVVTLGWLIILQLERMGKLPAERHAILLLFKTERGMGFIDKVARYKWFWKVFGSAAILIGILGMALVVFSLAFSIYSTYILRVPSEGAMFVIPGVTIPFWYGIFALISVLVVHEFSHGILARSENISIKSMGAILVTIIPIGAFVEPDEEELKSAARVKRMRVYAAGSFANILLAIFVAIPLLLFSGFFFDSSTIQIGGVVKCSPADGTLENGMVLKDINGKPISDVHDFVDVTSGLKPDSDVRINTDRGEFTIRTSERPGDPDIGYIGIRPTYPLYPGLPEYIYSVLYWIFQLNLGIGLINLAPLHLGIAATDGLHILKDILEKFNIRDAEKATMTISMMVLIVLAVSLFGPSPAPNVVC